jgi:hypothetical protein
LAGDGKSWTQQTEISPDGKTWTLLSELKCTKVSGSLRQEPANPQMEPDAPLSSDGARLICSVGNDAPSHLKICGRHHIATQGAPDHDQRARHPPLA